MKMKYWYLTSELSFQCLWPMRTTSFLYQNEAAGLPKTPNLPYWASKLVKKGMNKTLQVKNWDSRQDLKII